MLGMGTDCGEYGDNQQRLRIRYVNVVYFNVEVKVTRQQMQEINYLSYFANYLTILFVFCSQDLIIYFNKIMKYAFY